jgi:hypothetical protein
MAMARITRQGLTAITFLVVVLWGCFLWEQSTVRQARIQTYRALRTVQYLKRHRNVQPASTPAKLHKPVTPRPAVG